MTFPSTLKHSVAAVVVTHEPDPTRLKQVLEALHRQVQRIWVVDNHSRHCQLLRSLGKVLPRLEFLPLAANLGVASALNVGIEKALSEDLEFVLLMDQDSIAADTMVERLIASYRKLVQEGKRVAAIGPLQRDCNTGSLSRYIRFSRWRIKQVPCLQDGSPLWVDHLITSGTLIPCQVLRNIGLMETGLFIDYVDTEWVLRAKAHGYTVYGDGVAILEHNLGEYRIKLWFLRHREIAIHKPFRYYYIFRNSLKLNRRAYMPQTWRRINTLRLTGYILFTMLFHPKRLTVMRMIYRGIRDGRRDVAGKKH